MGSRQDGRSGKNQPEQDQNEQDQNEQDQNENNLVMLCHEVGFEVLENLLARYGLRLRHIPEGEEIPGSYWDAPEAGLIGLDVYVRGDTPIHSLLHESCHVICMDPERRGELHTEAGGEDVEENAVCYLQLLLADQIPGFGRERAFLDMDRWGYSFRLGSARAWFHGDAEDARGFLIEQGLLEADNDEGIEDEIIFALRTGC